MESPPSLARHLCAAATRWPQTLALLAADRHWTYRQWLGEVAALAESIQSSRRPLIASGTSLDLARNAFACSLKNRPFQPVDRAAPGADGPLPPGIAIVIATSGSEGEPRGVMLSDAGLDAAAAAANDHLSLLPGDLWLDCLSLHHIGGLSILWRCTRAGAGVLLHEGFAVEAVAKSLANQPVTHLSLVPAMLARLVECGARPLGSLRHVVIGGAALSGVLHDRATSAGWPLNPSYGLSETAAQVATHRASDGPWHVGLVGHPLGANEFALTADDRIRGPQVMAGYVDGSGVDDHGWLTTGDLGKIDEKGRLTVTGRADDMLISGGRNIHPLTVESCLAACPGIHDVAVTGLPDPVWGDSIVALVVGDATPERIRAWCRTRLPGAALPRHIVRLPSLPRNATGKLERGALRRLAREAG